jgi:hypothetical protein
MMFNDSNTSYKVTKMEMIYKNKMDMIDWFIYQSWIHGFVRVLASFLHKYRMVNL